MSTVKFNVPISRVTELQKDLRKQRAKHYPFRRQQSSVEVELFPNANASYFLLKYTLTHQ